MRQYLGRKVHAAKAAAVELIRSVVPAARQAADVGAGFVPGVSTAHDLSTVATGHNYVTGDDVGLVGRGFALAGALTPFSGGHIRGGVEVGQEILGGATGAIQRFATKHGVDVAVVGSRARDAAGPASDWDYIVGGNARIRHAARRELPRGAAGGEIGSGGFPTGIDIFTPGRVLGPEEPFIVFRPR